MRAPLARTRGEHNRLLIECDDGYTEDLLGKGAGRVPTSLAVMADLFDLARLNQDEAADAAARRAS